jgi:DNA-binding LacI/PurR family transcriptional regulator
MDIAKRCGIGVSSVSHALRGTPGEVSSETRERILAAAREIGYDPSRNLAAKRMRTQRNGTHTKNHSVGIALPGDGWDNIYFARILAGAAWALSEDGYGAHIVLQLTTDAPLSVACRSGDIDGILAVESAQWYSLTAEKLRAEPNFGDRPIIGLVDPIPGYSCVHADDYKGAYSAAMHLLELGHQHLLHGFSNEASIQFGAMVTPEDVYARRRQGIHQAFRDRGLDPEEHTYVLDLPHNEGSMYMGGPMVEFLRSHPEVTAVCAPNDFAAPFIWSALIDAGFRIPEDISLISFDDTDPIYSSSGRSVLTTVRLPLREIGRQGAKLIMRAIDGEIETLQNIVLPTELIVRGSTAAPKR